MKDRELLSATFVFFSPFSSHNLSFPRTEFQKQTTFLQDEDRRPCLPYRLCRGFRSCQGCWPNFGCTQWCHGRLEIHCREVQPCFEGEFFERKI